MFVKMSTNLQNFHTYLCWLFLERTLPFLERMPHWWLIIGCILKIESYNLQQNKEHRGSNDDMNILLMTINQNHVDKEEEEEEEEEEKTKEK